MDLLKGFDKVRKLVDPDGSVTNQFCANQVKDASNVCQSATLYWAVQGMTNNIGCTYGALLK